MKITRHFPKDEPKLLSHIMEALAGADSVVFQAGHFLLVYEEGTGRIAPCILGEPNCTDNLQLAENYGRFPLLTWQLALRILDSLPACSKHLMVVVNDWQYLPAGVDRATFYENQGGRLPVLFQHDFDRRMESIVQLQPSPLKRGVSTAPFFGEMNLRNRYQRHVSKLINKRALPDAVVMQKSEHGLACSLRDPSGKLQNIYCSGQTGDCTAEISEMLYYASTTAKAPYFVNLYPLLCRDFIEFGTVRAVELFAAPLRCVINIGFSSAGVSSHDDLFRNCEASIHEFD